MMLFVRRMLLLALGVGISGCIAVGYLIHVGYVSDISDTGESAENVLFVDSPAVQPVTLPAKVHGTQMIVQTLAGYDGAYLEDGTNDEVTGVAAVLVHNQGDAGILRAEIVLERGSERYVFCIELLPAGESVLVLEESRKAYATGILTACTGWAVTEYGDWERKERFQMNAFEPDSFIVKNLTKAEMQNVKVYYKPCYENGLFCIGGRSRRFLIGELAPGASVVVSPPDYSSGHSHILYLESN